MTLSYNICKIRTNKFVLFAYIPCRPCEGRDASRLVNLARDVIQVQPEKGTPLYITNDTSTLSESTIRMLFQVSFLAARERIWIGSPYFIPDRNTRNVLIQARQKGVDVRVLTMGQKNDKPIVRFKFGMEVFAVRIFLPQNFRKK